MGETADGDPVMTSTMKAAVKLKPAPNSTELRNIPIPDPSNQEVLIRVDIASICGTDVHIYDWDAWAARRIKVPLVQGHEFAGHIETLGSGVTGLRKGDYVSAEGHFACDVALRADVVAFSEARDAGPQCLDVSSEFVTLDQRHLDPSGSPRVPIVDVDVGAANRRDVHADQDFLIGRIGDRDVPEFRAVRCRFELHRGFHG